jgi:hypothetical protein
MNESIESRDDTLAAISPGLADARDKWWQTWEDANLDSRGRSNLSYDIEQGWDAAWECIEQFLNENSVQFEREDGSIPWEFFARHAGWIAPADRNEQ